MKLKPFYVLEFSFSTNVEREKTQKQNMADSSRYIDEYGENQMSGVRQVIPPESFALASVKRLFRAWAKHAATDKGIVTGAPEVIADW